jgi:hypothetical protein
MFRWAVTLATAVLGVAFWAGAARAACDCATSTSGPYCSGNSVTVSSGVGGSPTDTLTVQFDSTYQCGQYVTGDFWVVGKGSPQAVRVTSTSPAWDGSRHGWVVNMVADQQRLDSRVPDFAGAPSLAPAGYNVGSEPVSFVKAIGRNTATSAGAYRCDDNGSLRESCVKFTAAVTFVNAPPDSDGDGSTADEFRPGPVGVDKIGPFRVDMLESRAASLPRFSSSVISSRNDFSFDEIRGRYGCAYLYLFSGVFQQIMPTDCLIKGSASTAGELTYGNNIAVSNRVAPLRFLLDDFNWNNAAHRQALTNYVQHGLDLAQMVHSGWRTRAARRPIGNGYQSGEGGITIGQKEPVVFAAYMLQQSAVTNLARGNYYMESDQVYRSPVDNRAYYGVGVEGTNDYCPDGGGGFEGGIHCYHPTKRMDAGCGASVKSYQSQVSNSAPYVALWVRLLGAESFWNDAPWLEFARAWKEGGRAPGHTGYHWSNGLSPIGCDNKRFNTGYESALGEQMWSNFKNASGGGSPTPPPPPPPPPPPADLPAPSQLVP